MLWENSSPNSTFAAQDVTLSQSVADFTYLKIYWRISNTNASTISLLISISDFKNFGAFICFAALGSTSSGSASYYRYVTKVSNTSIYFDSAAARGGQSASTAMSIPTKICGVK